MVRKTFFKGRRQIIAQNKHVYGDIYGWVALNNIEIFIHLFTKEYK